MKKVLYIGHSGFNRDLFLKSLEACSGLEGAVSSPEKLPGPGCADLAVIDCLPNDVFALFKDLSSCAPRALCVPPLGPGDGNPEKFLRIAKRCSVPVFPVATFRFNPGLAAMFEVLGSGVAGDIIEVEYQRTGEWPCFLEPRGEENSTKLSYWDCSILTGISASLSAQGKEHSACVTAGEFGLSICIRGGNGSICHEQKLSDKGQCLWTLVTDFPGAGSRKRSGSFSPEMPLAIELCRTVREEKGEMSKREMKDMVKAELKLQGACSLRFQVRGSSLAEG